MANISPSSVKCYRYEEKLAVVTGSSEGIGYAIAERFAKEGGEVIIVSRNMQKVKNAVDKLNEEIINEKYVNNYDKVRKRKQVRGINANMAIFEDRKKLINFVTEHGKRKVDVLVTNVATNPALSSTVDTTEKQYDKIFNINVKATFLLIKEMEEHMNVGGNILIVSSYAGYSPSLPIGMYGVSKTALLGLTKALASDLYLQNEIRVNCIAPGLVRTRFSEVLWKDTETEENSVSNSILRRAATADEIAGAAAFLCSNDASYITAETLCITGGMHCRL